jgi:enolase
VKPVIRIVALHAREVLDSRGNPTVEVVLEAEGGAIGRAAVPSGASTGSREAVERRDGGPRYLGKGVRQAVGAVRGEIAAAVTGRAVDDQAGLDAALVELDGTPDKSRLGANALLGVSLAAAHAAARAHGLPLYRYLGGGLAAELPVPLLNVINGGRHADNPLDVQEFMLVPHGLDSFPEALRAAVEVYHSLHRLLVERGLATGVGDEGGFAPSLAKTEDALDLLVAAIERAGYRPGEQVAIALDPAASEFRHGEVYRFEGKDRDAGEMVQRYGDWAVRYPLLSIEDGMAEDDWEGWAALTSALGRRLQLVGDDVFVTNTAIFRRGIEAGVANAILIKPNQIGTVSETFAALEMAARAGYRAVMSHRSGETDDASISHLAVASGCGQIKAGAPARGERVAKYNELLRIADELGGAARFPGWRRRL